MLRGLAGDGCAVGLVTHDVDFAAEASHRVTTVARGRVLADAAPVAVLAHGGYFACQVGLALGCTTVAEAAEMLRGETGRVHV
jgi:energy-coupling factor transport system ATP-binding protein